MIKTKTCLKSSLKAWITFEHLIWHEPIPAYTAVLYKMCYPRSQFCYCVFFVHSIFQYIFSKLMKQVE